MFIKRPRSIFHVQSLKHLLKKKNHQNPKNRPRKVGKQLLCSENRKIVSPKHARYGEGFPKVSGFRPHCSLTFLFANSNAV